MNLKLLTRDPVCAELVQREIKQDPHLRFKVLVADDSEFDRLLSCLALLDSSCLQVVGEVRDGVEAMQYLSGAGKFADRQHYPFPDLLLLDLQMPHRNGLHVLEWIQQQGFKDLEVVVLSSSLNPANVAKVLELGAHCYEEKTSQVEDTRDFVERLEMLMVCRQKCPRLAGIRPPGKGNLQIDHCVTAIAA